MVRIQSAVRNRHEIAAGSLSVAFDLHPDAGQHIRWPAADKLGSVPQLSGLKLKAFTWYARRYLRRHFHSLRVSRAGLPPATRGLPVVVYSNHASWWDPMVCLVLRQEFFPERFAFAPIDAAMLVRYNILRGLGFFGVEQGTRGGAREFLRIAEAVLNSPQPLLALTPQGRFADARERPVHFAAGLGHLASRVRRAVFVPFAMEYVFWEERLPEILVRFGEAVEVGGKQSNPGNARFWTLEFEQRLCATQDALAAEAKGRHAKDFQIVLRGGAGQGGVYDLWKWLRTRLNGERFRKEHGTK